MEIHLNGGAFIEKNWKYINNSTQIFMATTSEQVVQ